MVAMRLKAGLLFQPEIIEVCKSYFRPDTAIVDLGANLGAMSVAFSRIAGDAGEVVSIEANPYIHRLLEMTLQSNGVKNVRLINAAAFDKSGGDLTFPRPSLEEFPTYGSYGIDPSASDGFKVKGIALDDVQIDRPVSFIKIDIQGADLNAMLGAKNLIAKDSPAILFEYEDDLSGKFGFKFKDYENFIEEVGYKIERWIGNDILIVRR